ncbi:MAG TPA: serine/threonine-protein kinase [Gemmatimonadaceae bacterium]
MPDNRTVKSQDALTVRASISAVCPACGAALADAVTSCGRCGAVITGGTDAEQSEKVRARLQEAIGDRYRLIELLGRGGMGIVFRAHEIALDREVALKVLALDPVLAPDAFARFEREAKLAAKLDHPNIVPIFGVGQGASIAFYTMRLVRGGSVEDLIGKRGGVEPERAIRILRDVAAALDHAHAQGVVHRDIKPANILLAESGHAAVADFGIAKALGGNSAPQQTSTGIIGSPGYMSPEQWRGEELDGRADQYALGIVAFEMLTGRRPFETDRIQDLLKLHMSGDVPDVATLRPGLDPSVNDAIRRALSKWPSERFGSSTAFVEALAGRRPVGSAARSVRVPAYRAPVPEKRKSRAGSWLVALIVAAAVGASLAPQTRPTVQRFAAAGVERLKVALGVHTSVAATPTDSLAIALPDAQLAIADPTTSDAGPPPSGVAATDGAAAPLVEQPAPITTPIAPVERRPIGFDTTHYGSAPAPFHRPAAPEWGFIKVLIINGVGEAMVDGETVGWAPLVARVAPGKHAVRVKGAGDLFAPSQITATVTANDTVTAVFAAPSSGAPAAAGATDTASPAPPASGATAPADSTSSVPPDSAASIGPRR